MLFQCRSSNHYERKLVAASRMCGWFGLLGCTESSSMLAVEAATMAITKARIESTGRWRRVHDAAFRPLSVVQSLRAQAGGRIADVRLVWPSWLHRKQQHVGC
jgi:hypothetical protein